MATNYNKLPSNSFTNQSKQDSKRAKSTLNITDPDTKYSDEGFSVSGNDAKKIYKNYLDDDLYKLALHGSNLFTRDEIDLYNNIYRFGLYNPYGAVTNLREYLFFTKPDLNIIQRDDLMGLISSYDLTEGLAGSAFWKELKEERPQTINLLQNSYSPGWNKLLQNSVISNLEIPSLEGTVTESPVNNYGVGFQYRGTSEASDDSIDFALEFKDTKWLDVYYFFRAYEDYQTLKHHGVVSPWKGYITNRILHDQFAIYKFLVDEDMETLVYWCKLYGVMPMNLPRDVFSTADFSNGLSYTINFKAAFFEDMRKDILIDFNNLAKTYNYGTTNALLISTIGSKAEAAAASRAGRYQLETYNSDTHTGDYRPAKSAYIAKYRRSSAPNSPSGPGKYEPKWVYKLKWKGDDSI